MSSCSAFVTGDYDSFFLSFTYYFLPLLYFPALEKGALRLCVRPLCAYFNSAEKPHTVLISPGGEFSNASMFAFNPGRIKVLQFSKGFFCQWFSHEARAV